MKIYNKIKIDIDSGKVLEEDSFEYNGPIAKCWGAAIGAGVSLLGAMMGDDEGEQTTRTEPWSQQVPYLQDIMGQGALLYHGAMPNTNNPYMGMDVYNQLNNVGLFPAMDNQNWNPWMFSGTQPQTPTGGQAPIVNGYTNQPAPNGGAMGTDTNSPTGGGNGSEGGGGNETSTDSNDPMTQYYNNLNNNSQWQQDVNSQRMSVRAAINELLAPYKIDRGRGEGWSGGPEYRTIPASVRRQIAYLQSIADTQNPTERIFVAPHTGQLVGPAGRNTPIYVDPTNPYGYSLQPSQINPNTAAYYNTPGWNNAQQYAPQNGSGESLNVNPSQGQQVSGQQQFTTQVQPETQSIANPVTYDGGGGGGQKANMVSWNPQSNETSPLFTGEQQAPTYGDLASMYTGGPAPYYLGQQVADFNDIEKYAQQKTLDTAAAGGTESFQNAKQGIQNQAQLAQTIGDMWSSEPIVNAQGGADSAINKLGKGVTIRGEQDDVLNAISGGKYMDPRTSLALQTGMDVYDVVRPEWEKTVNGAYLDPSTNPWLAKTYQKAFEESQAARLSQASQYGAYGGSDYTDWTRKSADDLATDIYGGNYQQERERQINAMYSGDKVANLINDPWFKEEETMMKGQGMLNERAIQSARIKADQKAKAAELKAKMFNDTLNATLGQLGLQNDTLNSNINNNMSADINEWGMTDRVAGVGESHRNQKQEQINADMNKWDYYMNEPWERLGKYQDIVKGNYGNSTTSPYYTPNKLSTLGSGITAITGALGQMNNNNNDIWSQGTVKV